MIEFPRPCGAIPIPPTPLIGREASLAAALALLGDPQVRLVSLIGPGGVGKTRLALELAIVLDGTPADGVHFVPLEAVADPDLVPSAIAQALGVSAFGGRSMGAALLDAVRNREQLLVLDNFEHLLAAAPFVAHLLAAGSGLNVLVTSREALRLRGEHALIVPPLALPQETATRRVGETPNGGIEGIAASPAVALFVQRARAARAGFGLNDDNAADIAAVCARLDGLPLAIELAAARVTHLSPGAIRERIVRQRSARFALLTGGPRDAPARLRTMRDAIAWSFDLLADDEQAAFRRLSVFVGGFGLDAAERVAGGGWRVAGGESSDFPPAASVLDLLASLVAKSLVRDEGDQADEPRFAMLETIRAFGLERLAASGDEEAVRARHAAWAIDFAEYAGAQARDPGTVWLPRLEREHANLRAALTWLLERGDTPRLVRLAGALWPFWEEHAHYREGRRWLETALASAAGASPEDRLRTLTGAGTMAWYEGDLAPAMRWHERALTLAREIGDRRAEAFALNNLGAQAMEGDDHNRAVVYFEASLAVARATDDRRATMMALHNLAQVARLRRDPAAAARSEEALALAREIGDPSMVTSALTALGHALLDSGDPVRAGPLFGESLELAHDRGNIGDVIDALEGLARVGAETGTAERAAHLFGAAAALRDAVGVPPSPSDVAYFEPATHRLRETLGDGLAVAVAAGRDLSQQESIAEALALAAVAASSSPHPSAPAANEGARGAAGLTHREREVLRLVVEGHSDKEIAAALAISAQTVAKHVGHILRKLDVASRTAAATIATRRGLV